MGGGEAWWGLVMERAAWRASVENALAVELCLGSVLFYVWYVIEVLQPYFCGCHL